MWHVCNVLMNVVLVVRASHAPAIAENLSSLGGLLWQACIFYTARCLNLWSSGPANSSVSLDRLHEEYVQKSRTRAFGSVCQARVARSKSHLERYRGARTVKIVYLGPVHARGGGVYGVPLNSKDIDVFPAVAVGKEETTIVVFPPSSHKSSSPKRELRSLGKIKVSN